MSVYNLVVVVVALRNRENETLRQLLLGDGRMTRGVDTVR